MASSRQFLEKSYFRCARCIFGRQLSTSSLSARSRLYRQTVPCRETKAKPQIRIANATRAIHTDTERHQSDSETKHHNDLHNRDEHEGYEGNFDEQEDDREHHYDAAYPGHIPTSLFQKALLSAGSGIMSIASPWRGDMIATLGETTGYYALVRMQQKMMSDPVGRQILQEQPRINTSTVDLDYLHQLPSDTFGRVYADWLDDNRCSPDARLPVQFVDDPDLAYVMQRYREIHDLVHALMGMPTHMLGEVVIKWVEAIQLGLPMCVSAALLGPIRLKSKQMQLYTTTHMWWAFRNGSNARFLMNVYYEHEWEKPIDILRKELNIEPPPASTPTKLWKNQKFQHG